MLNVKNLNKSFKSGDNIVLANQKINFKVKDGEFVSIVGASGSGKSTLLSLLGALDKPSDGEISINNRDITKLNDKSLTKYRSKEIGFIFQNYNLVPNLTALENVMLPMEFIGSNKSDRISRAKELLTQVGLEDDKQLRKPGRLSGGEQQRVAIARALANKPKLILADEPTGNLDSKTGSMIFDLLHSLAKSQNTTILVVTHDLEIAGKTDRKFTIKDGKLS